MTPPLFVDSDLARALEGAEVATCSAFCRAAIALYPLGGIRDFACAGGAALYYGPSDPLNGVKGVGLAGPVNVQEWDAIEKFHADTRSPVVVDLCPFADSAFVSLLGQRGYLIGSFETVMFKRLGAAAPEAPTLSGCRIDVVAREDSPVWNRVLDLGFASGGEPIKFAVDIGRVRAALPHSTMLLATVEGVPAGGAGLSIHGNVAHMSGAAVLPAYRGRGLQQALTAARLRIAKERACTLAKLDVSAGSASYRNAVRAGFQIAYTRPQLLRTWK